MCGMLKMDEKGRKRTKKGTEQDYKGHFKIIN
jgi:hypothetical protein